MDAKTYVAHILMNHSQSLINLIIFDLISGSPYRQNTGKVTGAPLLLDRLLGKEPKDVMDAGVSSSGNANNGAAGGSTASGRPGVIGMALGANTRP